MQVIFLCHSLTSSTTKHTVSIQCPALTVLLFYFILFYFYFLIFLNKPHKCVSFGYKLLAFTCLRLQLRFTPKWDCSSFHWWFYFALFFLF